MEKNNFEINVSVEIKYLKTEKSGATHIFQKKSKAVINKQQH